jgi:hypothetical protein
LFFLLALSTASGYSDYAKSPFVDGATWDTLKPYFLPESHPIKKKLDHLFTRSRVGLSSETLKEAKFKLIGRKLPNHVQVCKHKDLKGYLLKLFTDDQYIGGEWIEFLHRIKGTEAVRQAVARRETKLLKVPKKWIYPLPINPTPPEGYLRQHFILVVEDMNIYSNEKNLHLWKTVMTQELFKTLCAVLQEAGMYDSVYPDNIPFSKDGGLAFIDTRHYHMWPVRIEKLYPYLNRKMKQAFLQATIN